VLRPIGGINAENLKQGNKNNRVAVDKPIAELIKDLNARSLLDDTIILWGEEFGGNRPRSQSIPLHCVFAGGGFQPG